MTDDPFERFERSRSGLMIPVIVFVIGAALTYLAIDSLNQMSLRHDAEANETREPNAGEPAGQPGGGFDNEIEREESLTT